MEYHAAPGHGSLQQTNIGMLDCMLENDIWLHDFDVTEIVDEFHI
jgi:hypothetical protein